MDGQSLRGEQGCAFERDDAGNYFGRSLKGTLYDCMAFGSMGAGYFSGARQRGIEVRRLQSGSMEAYAHRGAAGAPVVA